MAVLLEVPRRAVVLLVAPSCGAVALAGTSGRHALLVHGARGGHRLARQVLLLRVIAAPVGRRPLLVVAVALGWRVVAAGGPALAVVVMRAVLAPRAMLAVSVALHTGQQQGR